MITLIFLTFFVAAFIGDVFSKKSSLIFSSHSVAEKAVFIILTGTIASIFFFLKGGLIIKFNKVTILYSIAFAVVCICSNLITLFIFNYISVSAKTVTTTSGGIIINALIGFFIFDERISKETYFKIVLILISFILVFLSGSVNASASIRKTSFVGIILSVSLVLSGGASTIINRAYARDTRVCDDNSFFFLTNVVMVLYGIIMLIIADHKEQKRILDSFKKLKRTGVVSVILTTISSNLMSICTLLLLARIDVSVYSPITSALKLVAAFVASLLYREKQNILTVLALSLAIAAVIV